MRPIGFSTGAVAKGDFRRAMQWLRNWHLDAIELSALRIGELAPLIGELPTLDLASFKFISIHAPSQFDCQFEEFVIEEFTEHAQAFPVVVHPDVIFTPRLWKRLGSRLLIENMDKRKPVGRTVSELAHLVKL